MKKRKIKQLPLPNHITIKGVQLKLRYFTMLGLMLLFLAVVVSLLPEKNIESDEIITAQDSVIEPVRNELEIDREQDQNQEPKKRIPIIQAQEKPLRVTPQVTQTSKIMLFEQTGPSEVFILVNDPNKPEDFELFTMPKVKPDEISKLATVESGDNMVDFLTRNHVNTTQAYNVIEAFKTVYNPRAVKAGDVFALEMIRNKETGYMNLINLSYHPTFYEEITVARKADDTFHANKEKKKLVSKEQGTSFEVISSLYGSAAKAGLPDHVIMDLIYIYSWKIDFQRDVRSGDKIDVFYSAQYTEDGVPTNNYNIVYASMMSSGKEIEIFRHEDKDGDVDFYTRDGMSVRQGLLKTPIAFGRVSSGYGMRHHPVLGYNKMHKGVDFAAPRGTKIFAAADGVIDKKYYSSSYGNYIRLKHTSGIKTAYAHMKSFAKGLKNGSKVKQGQTIGYVGTTGRSTGPHLHYEVLKNGKQVNPRSVDLPTQNVLKGQEKELFDANVKDIERRARIFLTTKNNPNVKVARDG